MEKNFEVLSQAQACYASMARFRRDRERNKRFNYGDQWSDQIEVGGKMITEEKFIRDNGSVPLKNNLIRRLVRSVIGVYNSQSGTPRCVARDAQERGASQTMEALLKYNGDLNRLSAVYTRSLEEFLISGLVAHRKWYGERNGRVDCWTDYVSPANFFVDFNMRDFRAWDCACVGEVHDVAFGELCRRFARSPRQCEELRRIYDACADSAGLANAWHEFGYPMACSHGFLMPGRGGMCRVIEAWVRECRPEYKCVDKLTMKAYRVAPADFKQMVERENARRRRQGIGSLIEWKWEVRQAWRYYFLTPLGDVLSQGESPYAHGSHPFVLQAYPLIDGEIHSFVSDVIDQQKYTNRLITMYDWMVRASAKGVLLIPEECIPRSTTAAEFARAWSEHNGVVVYRPSMSGDTPRQITGNIASQGITELLNLQLKFFEDISGVNGALQGKLSNSAMSAELYGQQTRNATTSLFDVLGSFNEFVRDGAYKDVSNMRQFYSAQQVRAIAGAEAAADIQDVEFDLSIAPCDLTASAKAAANEQLLEIWRSGQITLEQMLSAGDFPFAEALRASAREGRQSR